MKKIAALTIFTLLFCLSGCTGDDGESTGTVFVDGTAFKVGSNTTERIYNMLIDVDAHRMLFTIREKTPTGVDPDVIELDINYENAIDGTYTLYPTDTDFNTLPPNFAMGDYNTPTQYFGNAEVSGTITVTDLGNRKYKIEFGNAVFTADDDSGETRTITGSCKPTFF